MKNGSPPQHHNVEYILFAEFDNKLGSILRCQYPKVIPIAHAINLASLMIPDNAERYPGRVDFTYFILYWNPISKEYELLPSEQNSIKGEHKILYFINVCNAILDPNNRRGATIQSVALGSHNPDFIKWKPFVTLLLDHIMKDQTNNNTEQLQTLLSPFLTRINKIDSFNNIPQRYLTQQIIQSVNDSVYEQTIIDNLIQPLLKYLPSIQDKYGNKVTTSHGLIQIFLFSGILPKLSSPMFYKTPICENILNESYIHTTIEYSRLALKIIRDVTLVLSHRNDIQAIFIYSNNLEKDSLGQLIFTISFLISGASISRSPSSSNVFPLPYVDISMLETLRDFIGTMRNMNYKIIVGVSNPIFKVQEDLYDIFYDIDEEKVQLSNNIKLIETEWKRQTLNILTRPYKLNDNINSLSRGLSNLNFKERVGVALSPLTPGNNSGSNSNSISLSNSSVFSSSLSSSNISNGRLTLMTSFMQLLIQEHHDNRDRKSVV